MRQKQRKDIDRAVELVSEALAGVAYDESNTLLFSKTLASCLEWRHKEFGDDSDLDRAIELSRFALSESNIPRESSSF